MLNVSTENNRIRDSTIKFQKVHSYNYSKNLLKKKQLKEKNDELLNFIDKKHWKQIESIKNFTKNLSSEKVRVWNHVNQSKEKNNLNFTESNSLETATTKTTVRDSRDKFFFQAIVPRLFSKMPVDCGTKFCSLEFHERRNVRKSYF